MWHGRYTLKKRPALETKPGRESTAKNSAHLFKICTTSSSLSTWSFPTFCGLCLTDVPHTRALERNRKHTLIARGSIAIRNITQVRQLVPPSPHAIFAVFYLLARLTGILDQPISVVTHRAGRQILKSGVRSSSSRILSRTHYKAIRRKKTKTGQIAIFCKDHNDNHS